LRGHDSAFLGRSEHAHDKRGHGTPLVSGKANATPRASGDDLNPRGEIHVPIGIPNAVDTLKTFVEAEGSFSPGFATYGICFWLYDRESKRLFAPTMQDVTSDHGLAHTGLLIPWTTWQAGHVAVKTEVCQVERSSPKGTVQIVGARIRLANDGVAPASLLVVAALRPMGPAGGPVHRLAVGTDGDALLVEGHPALVANSTPQSAGVSANDDVGRWASDGRIPAGRQAESATGDCSGALGFALKLAPQESKTLGFICPVLPGRRAVGHEWDGTSDWAQLDLARPNPPQGGVLQPDLGLDFFRRISADALFSEARECWEQLAARATIRVPDPRWAECFAAIVGHAALAMNDGAPDVAVVNYNVFNRDGVYVANILQKSGNLGLAEKAIGYFLEHPFNGRTRVEADNPGQVLWAMAEHWRFSRDRDWLRRVLPSAAKLAAMIRYYRTTPGPHYVKATSLEFGDGLPPDRPDEKPAHKRQVLKPGSCDGHHPEYTEAFDVAGLRAAATLARAAGNDDDAARWSRLADALMEAYDEQFGDRLPKAYGNYSVLWPCRLYPFTSGKAYEQFKGNGATTPGGWRYFALAKAHQGLLAGNRQAGYGTIANHLEHPQMHGWYAFDEGGRSGSGGWRFARTQWKSGVAMPHGWAVAEMWLLLRDCLVFEHDDRLRLLSGVAPEWFIGEDGMTVEGLPTHFGRCSFDYRATADGATLTFSGDASPPGGFDLALPPSLAATLTADGREITRNQSGVFRLPAGTKRARLEWR
jgi:hypothetical protein